MHRIVLVALFMFAYGQDDYIVGEGYITTRIEDYWFEFHATHHILLIVGASDCHIVAMDDVMEKQMRNKDEREKLENDIYLNYVKPKVHESRYTLKQLRDEFHDLYANFQCIDKHVYKVSYVQPSQTPDHTALQGPGQSTQGWGFPTAGNPVE